ncbi:hypothetical protein [Litorimonas haliclonae]|uniref:hypothetical protein n=1 Tax=Litorimonas haliclonae TaxID=2081977 RepID=UPI0039F018A6
MTADELFLLSSLSRLSAFTVTEKEKQFGINGWLANKNYKIRIEDGEPILSETQDDLDIVFANEIARLGSASIETISLIRNHKYISGAAPWGLIKLYYASFFAANSTLRLFGQSCTYLSSGAILEYQKMRNIYGIVEEDILRSKSLYHVSSPSKSEVSFARLKESHQDTWKTYVNLLKELPLKVNQSNGSNQTKASLIAHLDSIQRHVENRRDGQRNAGWMSTFRNDVNYKQEYGIWHPSKKNAKSFHSHLIGRLNTFLKSSSSASAVNTDLDYMVESALLVIQLFFNVLNFNVDRVKEPTANLSRLKRQLNEAKLIQS